MYKNVFLCVYVYVYKTFTWMYIHVYTNSYTYFHGCPADFCLLFFFLL